MLGLLPMATASALTANTKSMNNDNILVLTSNATTSSTTTTIEADTGWFLTNFIGNGFRVIFSWFSDVLQAWKLFWWPSTKILTTPNVGIELFQDTGEISVVNITKSIPPSLSKVYLQAIVQAMVLQTREPTYHRMKSNGIELSPSGSFLPSLPPVPADRGIPIPMRATQDIKKMSSLTDNTDTYSQLIDQRLSEQDLSTPSMQSTTTTELAMYAGNSLEDINEPKPTMKPSSSLPSKQPSTQPSRQPSSMPTRPSGQPSVQPTRCIVCMSVCIYLFFTIADGLPLSSSSHSYLSLLSSFFFTGNHPDSHQHSPAGSRVNNRRCVQQINLARDPRCPVHSLAKSQALNHQCVHRPNPHHAHQCDQAHSRASSRVCSRRYFRARTRADSPVCSLPGLDILCVCLHAFSSFPPSLMMNPCHHSLHLSSLQASIQRTEYSTVDASI